MIKEQWYKSENKLPTENTLIKWMDSGGRTTVGKYYKNMFWLTNDWGEKEMYIYYTPQCWKYI